MNPALSPTELPRHGAAKIIFQPNFSKAVQLLPQGIRHEDGFPSLIVEAKHTGFRMGDQRFALWAVSGHFVYQVEGAAAGICDAQTDGQDVSMEAFPLVYQGGIGHDEAGTIGIQFTSAEAGQELQAHLVEYAQQGVMPQVPPVIDVLYPERDACFKGHFFRQIDVNPGHAGSIEKGGRPLHVAGERPGAFRKPWPGG